jgi:hypothetical protein
MQDLFDYVVSPADPSDTDNNPENKYQVERLAKVTLSTLAVLTYGIFKKRRKYV